MFADFFIKRPVFAIVCSLIILLVGVISIPTLPVAQYPDVSPVQIVVSANYPGASAQVVEETVTIVLEQQINGVEGMRYINSTSSNDGTSTIIVTFKQGYDKDIAAVDVQKIEFPLLNHDYQNQCGKMESVLPNNPVIPSWVLPYMVKKKVNMMMFSLVTMQIFMF
jgi:multidrug efflux pump subunit AcrB